MMFTDTDPQIGEIMFQLQDLDQIIYEIQDFFLVNIRKICMKQRN